jgi:mRNA-degrading endonuclease YafQ of YafQ-DinJ toxin-antitoxin module
LLCYFISANVQVYKELLKELKRLNFDMRLEIVRLLRLRQPADPRNDTEIMQWKGVWDCRVPQGGTRNDPESKIICRLERNRIK